MLHSVGNLEALLVIEIWKINTLNEMEDLLKEISRHSVEDSA